ncbi:MAG: MAE_28990/MAE_18760 family HEPN-like nuclease [Minicystis sp.]
MAAYGLNEFLTEVEGDLAWRTEEVRALKRLLSRASDGPTEGALRRSLILFLYAHAEGGVKTTLTCYVRVINALKLQMGECVPPIVAAAFDDLFRALSDQARKHPFFRSRLPDDPKIHRMARHTDFVARIREAEAHPVQLDHETIVDTESNLDPDVLMKILFHLGFPPDVVSRRFDDLHYLRGLRNAIAHGERRTVTEDQCAKYERTVFQALLPKLRDLLATAIRQESFRRNVA